MKFQELCDIYDKELTEIENLIIIGKMNPLRVKILEILRDSVLREQEQLDDIKRYRKYRKVMLRRIPGWKESIQWSEHVRREIEKFQKEWVDEEGSRQE